MDRRRGAARSRDLRPSLQAGVDRPRDYPLDAVGNIPFLRAVRAAERPQMTTVFRTYIDLSELLPSALFALLLSFFGLASVFAATGILMLAIGLTARLLPRRL